jgi:phosphoribosylformylglycinamidine cyclo-ligase
LLEGWREAVEDAGAVWGGGESPSLSDLVSRGDIELAGSAVGLVPEGRAPVLGQDLEPGDEIVLISSSGLHANGASLARKVARDLPDGYATALPSGREFGEALLDRTVMYVPLVRALLEGKTDVRYFSHITGHGLLKLMRPRRDLTYRIRRLPEVPEVLTFLSRAAGLDPSAAYSTLNMGAGFAVYCARGCAENVVKVANQQGLVADVAGHVEEGPRRVILEELDVTFDSEELDLGPSQPSP